MFDSESVYKMTSPIRGRCLIINNNSFSDLSKGNGGTGSDRKGSEVDVENISGLFKSLAFKWETIHRDLTAKKLLETIQKETEHADHKNYGMFVLVVMTHGSDYHLSGSDGVPVPRTSIFDLLSASQFPSMAGKPKLLIFQACSGGKYNTN
ncbi:cell death protein 3-like [Watersipora subatra]|uniref:cell death protein 3-like n=1 Tax=Watersipora subatra TaxID=2589382 RepID=UPI00355C3F3C